MAREKRPNIAPFDDAGSMLQWTGQPQGVDRQRVVGFGTWDDPDRVCPVSPVLWRPCEPFRETMTITGMERGRSAVNYIWHTEDERKFYMFASDFLVVVLAGTLGRTTDGLTVRGEWQIRKNGSSYGVVLLRETKET